MKAFIQQFLLHGAVAAIGCMLLISQVGAQTLTNIYNFSNGSGFYATNSDGAGPGAGLALAGGRLYGTTSRGGIFGYGAVFAVNLDGSGFTNLHSFTQYSDNHFAVYTNADGANPRGSLILSGDTLFGTAGKGGAGGSGAVFALRTDGSGFTNLYSFAPVPDFPGPYTNSDGAGPSAGLLLSGTTLYGTTSSGGSGSGTVFALQSDGSGFTNLHTFTTNTGYPNFINADGSGPLGKLILSGNRLYGTTASGGINGNGVIFAVNADGSGFTNIHSFAKTYNAPIYTNNEGADPQAELLLVGDMLYGTAKAGGWFSQGSVFGLTTNGTGFTNLHSFTPVFYSASSQYTNTDGAAPSSGLVMQGGALFGTASSGGVSGQGTLFKIRADGTGFENLHNFAVINSDGSIPQAALVSFGGALFGTTSRGGTGGGGTVFSYSFAPGPVLTITASGTNVVITWPTASAGFVLQSAPAVSGPFTNLPGAGNPCTNPITGVSQFYRLSK